MAVTRRRPGSSIDDWVREFGSIWHLPTTSWRLWLTGAIFGIGFPVAMVLRLVKGEPVDTRSAAVALFVLACAIGAGLLVVGNRLRLRGAARDALETEAFAEIAVQLGLRRTDDRRFYAVQAEAHGSIRRRAFGPERVIDAFTATVGDHEILIFDLEQSRGDAAFRVVLATKLRDNHPRASFASAPLVSFRQTGYPGVALTEAAKDASDELCGWVAEQERGVTFYMHGTWALSDFRTHLDAGNVEYATTSLAEFAHLIDSGVGPSRA